MERRRRGWGRGGFCEKYRRSMSRRVSIAGCMGKVGIRILLAG
jgi:hypothetical protein